MPDSHNKIVIAQSLKASDRDGNASADLIRLLNLIARKLNAADSLDSATATTITIVQALQK